MYIESKIRSFSEKEEYAYIEELMNKINNAIQSTSKDYILNIDEDEFINYLEEKNRLIPLKIDEKSEHISEPAIKKEYRENRVWGERFVVDVYEFKISYLYSGTKELFGISPSTKTLISYDIFFEKDNIVSFVVELTKLEEEDFIRVKKMLTVLLANLSNINNFVDRWNNGLRDLIKEQFLATKNKYIKENSFLLRLMLRQIKKLQAYLVCLLLKKLKHQGHSCKAKNVYS